MGDVVAPGRDDEAVRRFVEHAAMTLSEYGLPRMPARVLMTMMSADEDALSAAELAERLSVSAAAISGALRYLLDVGVLDREPAPRSRRDRYRLPVDPWFEAHAAKDRFFATVTEIAEQGLAALREDPSPSRARVAEMRDFFLFWRAGADELLARWRSTRVEGAAAAADAEASEAVAS